MFKNVIKYMDAVEYEDLIEDLKESRIGKYTEKNIDIVHEYKNVEFVNFLFKELLIDKEITELYENNYDALYDILKEIPDRMNEKIRNINLRFENKNYISEKMFKILEYIQEYFAEEIIECGSEDSFPISFDIYIKN